MRARQDLNSSITHIAMNYFCYMQNQSNKLNDILWRNFVLSVRSVRLDWMLMKKNACISGLWTFAVVIFPRHSSHSQVFCVITMY